MKKHYVLVYPDGPIQEGLDKHQRETLFSRYAERVEKISTLSAGSVRLPGGLLLLEQETADTVLGLVYHIATSCEVTIKLRFLSED